MTRLSSLSVAGWLYRYFLSRGVEKEAVYKIVDDFRAEFEVEEK